MTRRWKLTTSMLCVVLLVGGMLSGVTMVVLSHADPLNYFTLRMAANKAVPIRFYGLVVDEKGQPFWGATVTLSVRVVDYGSFFKNGGSKGPWREEQYTFVTGVDGRFECVGVTGVKVSVDDVSAMDHNWLYEADPGLRREEPNTLNRTYYYSPTPGSGYTPDRDNPAVFPLYAKGVTTGVGLSRGGWTPNHEEAANLIIKGVPHQPREKPEAFLPKKADPPELFKHRRPRE